MFVPMNCDIVRGIVDDVDDYSISLTSSNGGPRKFFVDRGDDSAFTQSFHC